MSKRHPDVPLSGFYTEEVRGVDGQRTGFDIVSICGSRRGQLARENTSFKGPKVGKYTVLVDEFESIAIPILQTKNLKAGQILFIDEIGKHIFF